MSDTTSGWEIRFTQAARKHRIGRASARHVTASTAPTPVTTNRGTHAWLYVGPDERGRQLKVIAVEVGPTEGVSPYLLVIHVMPTQPRGGHP